MRTLAILIALAVAAAPTRAQAAPRLDVGLDEHVGAQVPRDLALTDTRGRATTLGAVIGDGRPTLLVLAYARCTMLCSVVLRGVAEAVRSLSLQPGRDFHLVVVSLDPRETPDEGARQQAHLLEQIGRTGDRDAWPYLVGAPTEIARLAATLGFRYAWDPRSQQYAHPAVVFILTGDGRVAEYVRGVRFDPDGLALSLRRAATGVITTPTANDLITCFHFDPALRAYQARIATFFQIGAGVVFAILTGLIVALFVWERRRTRAKRGAP